MSNTQKFNISALEPNWRFQLPGGQWMTVVEVRGVGTISLKRRKNLLNASPGYSEVETKEPYSPRTNQWFTAPNEHRVPVLMCSVCTNHPGVVLDILNPRTALGGENRRCTYCAGQGGPVFRD